MKGHSAESFELHRQLREVVEQVHLPRYFEHSPQRRQVHVRVPRLRICLDDLPSENADLFEAQGVPGQLEVAHHGLGVDQARDPLQAPAHGGLGRLGEAL